MLPRLSAATAQQRRGRVAGRPGRGSRRAALSGVLLALNSAAAGAALVAFGGPVD